MFHIYSLDRERSPGQRTLQVLICAAGGSRAADGQRLLQAGIGAYFDDQDETHIIGKKWLYGPTPAHGEQGYGFDDDSGATGSIDQDPSGELEGSFLGPFPSPFNDYFRNAVAGWWEHPCLDGDMCRPADGSTVFQGSLAGALWEFHDDPGADRRFRVALFFAVSCADPSACP